jgi:hypothetical protein
VPNVTHVARKEPTYQPHINMAVMMPRCVGEAVAAMRIGADPEVNDAEAPINSRPKTSIVRLIAAVCKPTARASQRKLIPRVVFLPYWSLHQATTGYRTKADKFCTAFTNPSHAPVGLFINACQRESACRPFMGVPSYPSDAERRKRHSKD